MVESGSPHNWDSKTRVLIVDDEPGIREVVSELLSDEGYAVRTVRDGIEALEAVARDRYDLVLTDIKMPRLDGVGLVRELRFRGYSLPVVLMSASLPDVSLRGLVFMGKPFEASRLVGLVASTLNRSRGARGVTSAAGLHH